VHFSMSSLHCIIHAILYGPLLASNIYWKYFSKILKNSRIRKFSRWDICIPPGLKGLISVQYFELQTSNKIWKILNSGQYIWKRLMMGQI
jgi:hypothetical protein